MDGSVYCARHDPERAKTWLTRSGRLPA
jgi:hypothetical protein